MLPLPLQVRATTSSVDMGAIVQQFVISGISGDYLVCHTLSGTSSGSGTIYVARPYLLRRSIWSGQTRNGITYTYTDNQTRSATTGGTAITEKVTPSYQAADVILAVGRIYGTSNVGALDFEDLNTDGRSWAKST
jgi:hypothetical protein